MNVKKKIQRDILKEYLSMGTTFDPSYFSLDSPFKGTVQPKLRGVQNGISWKALL